MADAPSRYRPRAEGTPGAVVRGDPPVRLRLGAKGLAVEDGRVLLIEERRADGSTFWSLPGGGVRPSESMAAGLSREVSEELGCGATVGEPVMSCRYRHASVPRTATCYLVFSCELSGEPAPNAAEDVVGAAWFDPWGLPETTLAPFARVVWAHAEGSR